MSGAGAGQGLLETLATYLMLHDNAYMQILGDAGGESAEVFALRSDRVSVEADGQEWPLAISALDI